MRAEVPDYEALQQAAIGATRSVAVHRVLELGVGTGETTVRLLEQHPDALIWGLDSNSAMLQAAQARCPGARFRVGRMQDPLPQGPFGLALSVLAVHHLHALE